MIALNQRLIRKYNVPGPRYTSYPTVPYWEGVIDPEQWVRHLQQRLKQSSEGISVYMHLPFCEKLCTFCGCNKRITKNHRLAAPYTEALLAEWALYERILGTSIKIKELHLGGGTPTFFAPEELAYLLEKMFQSAHAAAFPEFGFEAHPNSTTAAHLETLYGFGFRRMSLGVQDFDTRVQRIIDREQSYEQIAQAVAAARTMGYTSINFDLIYGLPAQQMSSIDLTVAGVKALRPDRIALYSFAFVPWIKATGQRKFSGRDLPDSEEKRRLYEHAKAQLLDLGYYEIGMDHFALPTDSLYQAFKDKTLHRNFMGYTPAYSKLSLGLGCSAIGDSWTAFAQNSKTVEAYQAAVLEEKKLPVFRGHLLTEEDVQMRRHILDLMCQGRTVYPTAHRASEIMRRLTPLLEDGLVLNSGAEIVITPSGLPFMRNVCMAFDLRLWDKAPDTPIFSKTI